MTTTDTTQKQRLQASDWDFLTPGVPFVLGQTNLTLRPLPAIMLLSAVGDLEMLLSTFAAEDFAASQELLSGPFLGRMSKLLEASSGLAAEDITNLPPEPLMKLVDNVIQVNLASRDGLKKTLSGLMGTIESLAPPTPTEPKP